MTTIDEIHKWYNANLPERQEDEWVRVVIPAAGQAYATIILMRQQQFNFVLGQIPGIKEGDHIAAEGTRLARQGWESHKTTIAVSRVSLRFQNLKSTRTRGNIEISYKLVP